MSVNFKDPRGQFVRRVSRLEAKSHSPLNAPIPGVEDGARQGSWLDNKISAFFLGLIVLLVVRVVMFHRPELVVQAGGFGLMPGMAGAYVVPLVVALLAAWMVGHLRGEFWVASLAGISLALFFEQFIMLIFPDLWGAAYSPEFVAFVSEQSGTLHGWHDFIHTPSQELYAPVQAEAIPLPAENVPSPAHEAPSLAQKVAPVVDANVLGLSANAATQ